VPLNASSTATVSSIPHAVQLLRRDEEHSDARLAEYVRQIVEAVHRVCTASTQRSILHSVKHYFVMDASLCEDDASVVGLGLHTDAVVDRTTAIMEPAHHREPLEPPIVPIRTVKVLCGPPVLRKARGTCVSRAMCDSVDLTAASDFPASRDELVQNRVSEAKRASDPMVFDLGNRSARFRAHRMKPCFKEGDGMLFRLVNTETRQWAYFNATTDFVMHIHFFAGPKSRIVALGSTTMTEPDEYNPRYEGELWVRPRCTELLFAGTIDTYDVKFKAVPTEWVR